MTPRPLLVAVPLFLLLSACAGFRGGWESVSYVGEPPAAVPVSRTAYESANRPPIQVPGLTLKVEIDNRVRTRDTQVILFALPVSFDPREVQTSVATPGRTRVRITVTADQPGFVFRPAQAEFRIGDQVYRGVAGFEFGRWNEQGQADAERGKWADRSVGESMPLEAGKPAYLSVEFDVPSPSARRSDLSLDLARALSGRDGAAIPLIRFVPARWKQGYT